MCHLYGSSLTSTGIRVVIKKEFRDLKKGATKGAQRICTYCTYFSEPPEGGLDLVTNRQGAI